MDLAAALLKIVVGDENEEIGESSRPARSLDDLDSWGGKDQRGRRDGRYGRGRDARGQRSGRGGRGRSQDNGMARLFLNVGRDQNIKPGDVLGAIAGESGISGRMIGSIDMYDKYTFVEVPEDCAGEVLECMKRVKIRGKNVRMELANEK